MKDRSRRRKYIVDKKLQYRLLAYNCIYFLVIVAVIGIALFTPLVSQLSRPDLSLRQQGETADKILYIHAVFWPTVVVLFCVFAAHSILISNKIAGPLHRFRRMFERIMEGDLSDTIKIRKGDYLLVEQTKISQMIEALRSRIEDIRGEQEALEEGLKELRRIGMDKTSSDAKRKLDWLEERSTRLKQEISFFKTSFDPESRE
jgi:methyl-accepting chemotaxis protein